MFCLGNKWTFFIFLLKKKKAKKNHISISERSFKIYTQFKTKNISCTYTHDIPAGNCRNTGKHEIPFPTKGFSNLSLSSKFTVYLLFLRLTNKELIGKISRVHFFL